MVRLSLCCLWLGWAVPRWVLAEEELDTTLLDSQTPAESQGHRVGLWLLSILAIYGLVRLLDDFTSEKHLLAGQDDTEVLDCDACPAHTPYLPRHGCAVKCTLKSLGRMEQDLVTLLYKLRKHKMALVTGYLSKDRASQATQGSLPNDVVIYTIQEES